MTLPCPKGRSTRETILAAGLDTFDVSGFNRATVAMIRKAAGVSNGSFFHFFSSKESLAAELFLEALRAYHGAMRAVLARGPSAREGVAGLVRAHLDWVVTCRRQAKFLFEQSRSEWMVLVRDEQRRENAAFGKAIETWRAPHVTAGELRAIPASVLTSQIIGPAQIFCRAWLSGREVADPRQHADALAECAIRATVADAAQTRSRGQP